MVQTLFLKVCPLILVGALGACGGGEDDVQPVQQQETILKPPENVTCQTTIPLPPDCKLTHK